MIRLGFALLLASAVPTAEAHDWYTGLHNGLGQSCCNDKDCRPVTAQPTPLPHIILNLLDYLPSAEN